MTAPPHHYNTELVLSTLDKGLRVLESLAERDAADGLIMSDLARRLGMNRTTVLRCLVTLRARGFVDRDPGSDRYRLGVGVLSLASALLENLDIRRVANSVLLALSEQTGELVHLAVLDRVEVVTVERIEGTQAVALQTEVGARRPAYCTASGKAILAHLGDDAVERILGTGMRAVTARTITSPAAMETHLAEVRRLGYAVDDEERVEGVRCVAAPVFGFDNQVVGAVSIAAPAFRTSRPRLRQLGVEVRFAADTVSARLGGRQRERSTEGDHADFGGERSSETSTRRRAGDRVSASRGLAGD